VRRLAREILAAGGPIARALGEGYEPRGQQLEMAEAVELALSTKGTLLAEAGTGVGKSFAYLVPAILRALAHNERVVIATNTIALQEQLIEKDIPFLRATLDAAHAEGSSGTPEANGWGLPTANLRPLVPALVKGRGNYVSIRRLRLASERQDRIFADEAQRRSLHAIEDWAYQTSDGTLSSLPALERPSVWDRVQSDSDNCMGRKCPTYEQCFYQQSRRLMQSANLLICNHAVFFADLNLRIAGVARGGEAGAGDEGSSGNAGGGGGFGFLPEYHHVILDEAHALEDVACDHFGLSLTESRVEHLLGVLYHTRTGRGYLPQLAIGCKRPEAVDAAHHAVLKALDASRAFFDELARAGRPGGGGGGGGSGRIREPGIVPNTLTPAMKALSLRLMALKEDAAQEADKFELNAYAIRAAAIAFDAEVLVSQSREGYVYWLETGAESEGAFRAGGGGGAEGSARLRTFTGRTRMKLACSPVEVAPLLRQHLFTGERSVVLTSATMTVPGRTVRRPGPSTDNAPASIDEVERHAGHRLPQAFGHIAERLGIDAARTVTLGSPFDHARQAEVFIDRSIPDPRGGGGGGGGGARSNHDARGTGGGLPYHDALAQRVLHHVLETEGGAFVLFTSFAALHAVADRLGAALADAGLPLLAQGRDGTPGQVLARFREHDRAVLLGAASFWQGVDVKGRGLRNVIITKLPFDPPDRPLVEARGELIRLRGGDPFRDDALPRAIIRFKQGFGRLIRSQTDFGRIVILDPRVETTAYGRRFLDALPPRVVVRRLG
jgi:ATP-dependent DNA helicase DinG